MAGSAPGVLVLEVNRAFAGRAFDWAGLGVDRRGRRKMRWQKDSAGSNSMRTLAMHKTRVRLSSCFTFVRTSLLRF